MGRWSAILLAALAGFQLARLLTKERGPLGIFQKVRDRLEVHTELVVCPYCCGLWFASIAWLLLQTRVGRVVVPWVSMLGAHTLVEQVSELLEQVLTPNVNSTVFVPGQIKVHLSNPPDLESIEDALRHLTVLVKQ